MRGVDDFSHAAEGLERFRKMGFTRGYDGEDRLERPQNVVSRNRPGSIFSPTCVGGFVGWY